MKADEILLLGCGIWGTKILQRLVAKRCRVHVVDPAASSREAALAAGAAGFYASFDDAPASVNGAVVATPAATHFTIVRTLLDSLPPSVPILCEKPLAIDVREAALLATGNEHRLYLDHTWRYHPGIVALGEIARSGGLGVIHGVRSTRTNWTSPRSDVDSVWNLVPHDITLALEILGVIPEPRAALAEALNGRAVGMWAFLGSLPWLVLESSNRFAEKRREVRLHAEHGVAVLPSADHPWIEITRERKTGSPPEVERVAVPEGDPLGMLLDDFLSRVSGGTAVPKSDAAEGLAVIATVAALRELAGLPA